MATYQEIYQLHSESILWPQVVVAVARAANYILGEPVDTPLHTGRIAWARDALINTDKRASEMIWLVLGNTDVQTAGAATTDALVQYIVESNINALCT